jgi:hypothetical protein
MLPWEFREIWENLGIDFNAPRFGVDLTPELHSALHARGYNDDWRDILEKYPDISQLTPEALFKEYMAVQRPYLDILERGKAVKGRYPWEKARRGMDKAKQLISKGLKGPKCKKALEAVSFLTPLLFLKDAAAAATGGCADEEEELIRTLERFAEENTRMRCFDFAAAFQAYLNCLGTPEAINAIQYHSTIARGCSELP